MAVRCGVATALTTAVWSLPRDCRVILRSSCTTRSQSTTSISSPRVEASASAVASRCCGWTSSRSSSSCAARAGTSRPRHRCRCRARRWSKEGNTDIYRAYTGGDATRAWDNLALLLSLVGPDHITVRVPLIPDFNTEADTDRTAQRLADMGVTRIDRFIYRVQ